MFKSAQIGIDFRECAIQCVTTRHGARNVHVSCLLYSFLLHGENHEGTGLFDLTVTSSCTPGQRVHRMSILATSVMGLFTVVDVCIDQGDQQH